MNKRILFMGAASLMCAFASCSTDDLQNEGIAGPEAEGCSAPAVLSALSAPETRTTFGEDNMSLVWSKGDAFAVFSQDGANKRIRYKLKSGYEGQSAGEFELAPNQTGNISKVCFGTFTDPAGDRSDSTYVAIYPSDGLYFSQMAGGRIIELGAMIPNIQEYVEGVEFDPQAVPMMAVFDKDDASSTGFTPMKFKFLASMLRLPLAAAEPTTLDKIEFTVSGGNQVSTGLAGRVTWQFYYGLYANKEDARDATFKDFRFPMDYQNSDCHYTVAMDKTITLEGDPIDLTSELKNINIGVLPSALTNYITMSFYVDDGSIIEKRTSSLPERKPGHIGVLPAFTLDVPYMPEVKLEGDSVYTWVPNYEIADSANYEVVISLSGAPIQTIAWEKKDEPRINIEKKLYPEVEKLVGSVLKAGTNYTLGLSIKATYNKGQRQAASAVYSVPVTFSFLSDIPEVNAAIKKSNFPYLEVVNYNSYNRVEFAETVITDGHEPTEADFAGKPYKTMRLKSETFYSWDTFDLYAVHVKAYAGNSDEVVKTAIVTYQKAAPTKINMENTWGDTFQISNYGDLTKYYQPTSITVYWMEGKDVTDFTDAPSIAYDSNGLGWDLDDFIGPDCWGKTWTIKVIMTGDKFEGGQMEGVESFDLVSPW